MALVRKDRLGSQAKQVFFGAPDLVVEILSPSNLHMDIDHLRDACLKDHCLEFWVVNLELRTVTVHSRGNLVRVCMPGYELPLDIFGVAAAIPVAGIFE